MLQAYDKQCVQLAATATSVDYQLSLPAPGFHGPGQLTVAIEHTPVQSSAYLHLTGLATKADIELGRYQPSLAITAASESSLQLPLAKLGGNALLSTPAPLQFGSAVQLKAFLGGDMRETPYYALSEELLENMVFKASSRSHFPAQTPHDGSLGGMVGLQNIDTLMCPAAHSISRHHYQRDDNTQLLTASQEDLPKPSAAAQQRTSFPWLPLMISLCLLLSTIGLAVGSRQNSHAASRQACEHATAAAQTAAGPSFVRSNKPILEATPTKDTGCSPFVPVTQAPVPHWPLDCAHLASCSSKIGSYKQKARPASSKAVTNMTSNVSGATKWQRNKNGRLLSLALDPDEHNS